MNHPSTCQALVATGKINQPEITPPLELEDVCHGLALPGVAGPGQDLHLVGNPRLELADACTAPGPNEEIR